MSRIKILVEKIARKLVQTVLLAYDIFKPSKGIPVLLYHKTTNEDKTPSIVNIDLFIFENQVKYLHKHGYRTINLSQLNDILYGSEELPSKTILITFDDGYAENIDAFEILHRYGYTCVCFIATAFIGQKLNYMPFYFDKDEMNEDTALVNNEDFFFISSNEIKEAQKLGVEFCPHTHHHITIDSHSEEFIIHEIEECNDKINEITGCSTDCFSYPVGLYDSRSEHLLKQLGFKASFAVKPGLITKDSNPYFLPRSNVPKEKFLFKLILTDKYGIYCKLGSKFKSRGSLYGNWL